MSERIVNKKVKASKENLFGGLGEVLDERPQLSVSFSWRLSSSLP
jgi:hypothetical protein